MDEKTEEPGNSPEAQEMLAAIKADHERGFDPNIVDAEIVEDLQPVTD